MEFDNSLQIEIQGLHIFDLLKDMLLFIFSLVETDDLGILCQVCRTFYNLLSPIIKPVFDGIPSEVYWNLVKGTPDSIILRKVFLFRNPFHRPILGFRGFFLDVFQLEPEKITQDLLQNIYDVVKFDPYCSSFLIEEIFKSGTAFNYTAKEKLDFKAGLIASLHKISCPDIVFPRYYLMLVALFHRQFDLFLDVLELFELDIKKIAVDNLKELVNLDQDILEKLQALEFPESE